MSRPDCPPARWRVVRRVGWSLVIHPTSDAVLMTTDHTSAIALRRPPGPTGDPMSTNFYTTATCDHPCAHCQPEGLHIGKRSAGWTFGFEAHDDLGLTTRKAWQAHLRQPNVTITDEYGQQYTPDEFDALVDRTREPWGPNRIEPRRRGGWNDWINSYDDRHYRDPEGWDFWRGEFS